MECGGVWEYRRKGEKLGLIFMSWSVEDSRDLMVEENLEEKKFKVI